MLRHGKQKKRNHQRHNPKKKTPCGGGWLRHGVEGGNMNLMIDSSHILTKKSTAISRRKAIRARCVDCSSDNYAEVRNCQFRLCALHPYRTGQGKQNPVARDKAIRKYCLWCMNDQRNEVRLCPSTDCPLYPYRLTRKAIQRHEKEHIGGLSGKKKSPAGVGMAEVC